MSRTEVAQFTEPPEEVGWFLVFNLPSTAQGHNYQEESHVRYSSTPLPNPSHQIRSEKLDHSSVRHTTQADISNCNPSVTVEEDLWRRNCMWFKPGQYRGFDPGVEERLGTCSANELYYTKSSYAVDSFSDSSVPVTLAAVMTKVFSETDNIDNTREFTRSLVTSVTTTHKHVHVLLAGFSIWDQLHRLLSQNLKTTTEKLEDLIICRVMYAT